MTRVSRRPLPESVYQRIFDIFFNLFTKIKNTSEAKEFFDDFFTPTEKIMFAKRVAIAFLLSKKYDYQSIMDTLHVSPPTISAVNISLKHASGGCQKIINKILREEKIEKAFLDAAEGATKLLSTGRGKGTSAWRDINRGIRNARIKDQL